MPNSKSSELKAFETCILEWNVEVPVDRWWRNKHKVAFNSAAHRDASFIDMYWEFYEDRLYFKTFQEKDKEEDSVYIPDQNDFVKRKAQSVTISEEEFDNIQI